MKSIVSLSAALAIFCGFYANATLAAGPASFAAWPAIRVDSTTWRRISWIVQRMRSEVSTAGVAAFF